MDEKNYGTLAGICLILFVIIWICFSVINLSDRLDYCHDRGYDGVSGKILSSEHRCYKEVPHESGTGTKNIYSGEFGDEVLRW